MMPHVAGCCCNGGRPCRLPSPGSTVQLKWHSKYVSWQRVIGGYTCECCPSTGTCSPLAPLVLTPNLTVPAYGDCAVSGTLDNQCSCNTCHGIPFGYLNGETSERVLGQDMPTAWMPTLTWVSNINVGATLRWLTPAGVLTSFQAPGAYRRDRWQATVPGLKCSRSSATGCGGCPVITEDAAHPVTAYAEFTAWPSYTAGPTLFSIRSTNAVTYSWDIAGGYFRIKNTTGSTVLWQYAYAGKTLAELKAAIAAQTAAPVSILWASPTGPDATSQAVLCDIALKANAVGGSILKNTQGYTQIVGFLEGSDFPNPVDGANADVVAMFYIVGWNTSVGSQSALYANNACNEVPSISKTKYELICDGLQFAGAGQECTGGATLNDFVLNQVNGYCGSWCPTGDYSEWNYPGSCGGCRGVRQCSAGAASGVTYSADYGLGTPICEGNLRTVTDIGAAFEAVGTYRTDYHEEGIDMSDCASGAAAYNSAAVVSGGAKVYEHRYVRRLS